MLMDTPPGIIYEIPSKNTSEEHNEKLEKKPISVMAFGKTDPNLGEDNTIVNLYDQVSTTMNAKIVSFLHAEINPQYIGGSWTLYDKGVSFVVVEFELTKKDLRNAAKNGLGLYLTHLSQYLHSESGYSIIKILVNGKVLAKKYTVASHLYICDDYFDLASFVKKKVLRPGKNCVEIQLHADAETNYWIHRLVVK